MSADKASLGSVRSFRSSEIDSTSISSMHKRIVQRIPKLNARTMSLDSNSGSNNIPETEEQVIEISVPVVHDDATIQKQQQQQQSAGKLTPASSMGSVRSSNGKSPTPTKKGLSKSNILRNIFFFQNSEGSSNSKS